MGVTGLWPVLAPSARPTPLPTLNRKRLAVDASIWIYQFLKAVRDKEGNALRNSHVVGFFRRICKLLYFGIKPVFVFDGGAPALKRQTVLGRKTRREGRREDAVRTAGRLLAVQMKRRGEDEHEQRKREREREKTGLSGRAVEEEALPDEGQMVYVGELGMSATERQSSRRFHKTDAYHLPDVPDFSEMGAPNDPRIMSAEELEEYARQFHSGEDVNLYDFSKIDFNGEFFMSLPPVDRYNILNAARLRSRLRMGLSKEQLEEMFPDRMAFSRFQIERVRERNELTQRLMNLNGMNDELLGVGVGRIAGESGREYVLVKNEGVEGGWALGVVSTDKGVGERNKPIDIDALHQKTNENQEAEESEDEFEDVPVEGLNRLPKLRPGQNLTDVDLQAKDVSYQTRQPYDSGNGEYSANGESSGGVTEEPGSLFVDDSIETEYIADGTDEDEGLARAIAMSLEKDDRPEGETDEEEHLYQAIALSLKTQHGQESEPEDEAEFEDIPMPEYNQRAVEAPKPLTGSSGGMIAHIVNNRASAAVPKRRAISVRSGSDSDSELDLQSALAKARKEKAPERKRQPAPVAKNSKNPFDGPLPFEKLDFRTSIFSKKGKELEQVDHAEEGEEEEDLPGGFDNQLVDEPSKPLPPWLVGSSDIRSRVEEQQRKDLELNAADRERAIEEERVYRLNHGPIEIDSSDNDSDVEVLDAPPPRIPGTKIDDMVEVVRVESPVPESAPGKQSPAHLVPVEENLPGSEDEQEDWSESEYGDIRKPAAGVDNEYPSERAETISKSNSISPDFEDVEVPEQNGAVKSPSPEFEGVDMPKSTAVVLSEQDDTLRPLADEDDFDRQQEDMDEFDFSDPDDDELLAQLAIEAEEHARFASTLNNKSERENQEAYERELKALRTQQKKDRRDADEVSHIMITECQALLRLFGIPYITAPMEAEAQCAELIRLGLVDGIVTDDSDIFLFGGTRVYKNMFNSNKFVECYLASDLEKELSLSRDQLISIAHLLGSDYTEGLPGIGPVTAVEIISEFPSKDGLQEFKDWWSAVQLSSTPPTSEPSTFRKKFRRSQGTKLFLPPGFPSPAVTEAYLKPDVDSTPEPFQWGVPDLDRLRDFLMATIGWDQERTDEVLVPVIRDMNRRATEGTQSNITRFFDGAVGTGVNAPKKGDAAASKRMRDAVSRLKAKKHSNSLALGETFADQAREWAGRNDLSFTQNEREKAARKKGRKRAADGAGEEMPLGDGDGEGEADDEGMEVRNERGGRGSGKRKKVDI
jgi:DNA excision repair protein ERCC-5